MTVGPGPTPEAAPCPLCQAEPCPPLWRKNGHQLHHCRACDLVFVDPLPTPEEVAGLYAGGDYHGWMAQWADQGGMPPESPQAGELIKMQRRAEQCLRLLSRHGPRPGRLLDVGCAAGLFLQKAQAAGWLVEGLELNPATARAAERSLGRPVRNLPLEEARLPEGELDALTAWDVIEHLRDPRQLLRQAWRALRPGGLLGLSTPNHRGLFPRLSLSLAGLTGVWPHPTPPWHLYQFSARGLEKLLGQEGFQVKGVEHAVLDLEEGFGTWRARRTSPKYLAYFLALGWSAWLGPRLKRGDLIFVLATKVARGA